MKSHCTACRSSKMIPDVPMIDQGQGSSGRLCIMVEGNPDAFFFKDKKTSAIKAFICGDCGHTVLRVEDPKALYRKYRDSLKK